MGIRNGQMSFSKNSLKRLLRLEDKLRIMLESSACLMAIRRIEYPASWPSFRKTKKPVNLELDWQELQTTCRKNALRLFHKLFQENYESFKKLLHGNQARVQKL